MADYFTPPPAKRSTRNSPPIGEIVQNGDSQEIILRLADDYITAFTRKIDLGRFMNVPVLQIRGHCRRDPQEPDCRKFGEIRGADAEAFAAFVRNDIPRGVTAPGEA